MKLLFLLTFVFFLPLFSDSCTPSVRSALHVWAADVVPSLFPYMVFCRLTAKAFQEKRVPAVLSAVLLGVSGGSPAGAAVVAAYGNTLPRKKLYALSAFCGTISPMFMLNTMNRWLDHPALCRILLLANIAGALTAGALVWRCTASDDSQIHRPYVSNCADSDAIRESIESILYIGGCISLFSAIASVLHASPVFHAVLEIAGGLHALIQSRPGNLPLLLSALTGFSGLSMLWQNLFFLRPLGIRMTHLLLFGLLRASFSCLFTLLLWRP